VNEREKQGERATELKNCVHIRSFHSIHNVVDSSVTDATWDELAGKVGHREQLVIC